MGAFLITGRSGSGKTRICSELNNQGYQAFDGDRVPGLAGWIDVKTGQSTIVPDYESVEPTVTAWNWDTGVLKQLLSRHSRLLLCGSADNQLEYHELFDQVFILTIPPQEQRRRLLARTEHAYGKSEVMQERIITEQAEFVLQALELGAIAVDATPSPAAIVNKLLRLSS